MTATPRISPTAPDRRKTGRAASVQPAARATDRVLRVVGLGASAGGLEALEAFLPHIPSDSGLAWVIVQHLDPGHAGNMVELLQRTTALPVTQVKPRTAVEPDHVYVIPPNKDLALVDGVLHALAPSGPRGRRQPITAFFRSLAKDQRDHSIGIVLSGAGSDGALGVRAIKAQGGLVLVQAPATAKFDSMPRSAIAAGQVDVVAPVAELPVRLLEVLRNRADTPSLETRGGEMAAIQLEKIVILLRAKSGHDFSLYKRTTLFRRIERRMGLQQLTELATYVRYLRENPQELDLLFKELLIGVTNFFRDPAVWVQLRDEVWPELLAKRATTQTLRAWVAGCSTGEEAYSLAMTFREAVERLRPRTNFTLQIYATDIDREAIAQARQGSYPASIATDVAPGRLARFFVKDGTGYRVAKEIREMVIFAPQNVIMDPPFTKLDLLTCRNLLIYFTPELQKKLFPLFHYSLNPEGVLLLGSAESVGGFTGLFAALPGKSRLFRRLTALPHPALAKFPTDFLAARGGDPDPARKPSPAAAGLQASAEQWLLHHRAPTAVLVNKLGDILFVSRRTGPYLEPAAGKANWNLFAMVRPSLRPAVTKVFQQARVSVGGGACRRVVLMKDARHVEVAVEYLLEPIALRGLAMVEFTDVPAPAAPLPRRGGKAVTSRARVHQLEQALRAARDDLQNTRDVMLVSQQDLKSLNEELQSTNEELQSSNEELTTSKEEMQSLNEELQTVNVELQAKVDELGAASNDMKNLLNSTEIATVFLDNGLRVRRFTEQAQKLFKFIPGDIGRPVTDLANDLLYPEMVADARDTLRTLVPLDLPVETRSGRWYAMRLMPYRTAENRIEGVVITFTDITTAKKLEAELRARMGATS